MTISRVKFPWPPFFRILIFFDEVFNSVRGTTYLMRDDGATVVKCAVLKSYLVPNKPYGRFGPLRPVEGLLFRCPYQNSGIRWCASVETSTDLLVGIPNGAQNLREAMHTSKSRDK